MPADDSTRTPADSAAIYRVLDANRNRCLEGLRVVEDGLRFVWNEPAIRSTAVLSTVTFTLVYSVMGVVLPVVYEELNQPQALGLLFMVFSAAGVAGALAYSALGTRLPRRPAFVVGLVSATGVAAVFALSPPYWAQLAAVAVGGFLTGPVNPIVNVVFQERTPEEMRGRALSMIFSFAYALYPIGYVAAGFMIKALGSSTTFGAMAVSSAFVALWAMMTPARRGMNAPEAGEPTG
jgi:MFS family permease